MAEWDYLKFLRDRRKSVHDSAYARKERAQQREVWAELEGMRATILSANAEYDVGVSIVRLRLEDGREVALTPICRGQCGDRSCITAMIVVPESEPEDED